MGDLLRTLRRHVGLLIAGPLLAGLLALAATYLIAPTYTATTTFLPPQQQQGAASSALAALGPLAGLAVGGAGLRTPADQFVALMQSVSVSDRIIDQFKLIAQYEVELRHDARRRLATNVRMAVGKKDGLISVEVDDTSPQRAADMANHYVEELRRLTSMLAITEAQQRRGFFEKLLNDTKVKLSTAQQALQSSGLSQGALKAEPKAAAENYARLRAEATTAEVRFQALRGNLADSTPEVRQQLATMNALRDQVARLEQATDPRPTTDYVSKFREFKYHETLFELYARQYELARVDESREGSLIQVVDLASAPERKSRPRHALTAAATSLAAALLLAVGVLLRRPKG